MLAHHKVCPYADIYVTGQVICMIGQLLLVPLQPIGDVHCTAMDDSDSTSHTHMAYHAITGPSSNASIHCQVPHVWHFYLTHPIRQIRKVM